MMKQVLPGSAYKAYVTVYVEFSADGVMLPRQIVWEDGVKYGIDRVHGHPASYAAKAGGKGIVIRSWYMASEPISTSSDQQACLGI